MSIFVTGLAFPGVAELEDAAKVAIFAASALCAVVGVLLLRFAGGELPASADETGDDVEVRVGLPSFAEGFSLARWSPPESARGQLLRDLALPATRGVWVVGVYPGDGSALQPAGAETLLRDGVDALVVGPRESVERLLAGAEPAEAEEPRRPEPPEPPESPESSSESVVA
jgi:hypothetical protein